MKAVKEIQTIFQAFREKMLIKSRANELNIYYVLIRPKCVKVSVDGVNISSI